MRNGLMRRRLLVTLYLVKICKRNVLYRPPTLYGCHWYKRSPWYTRRESRVWSARVARLRLGLWTREHARIRVACRPRSFKSERTLRMRARCDGIFSLLRCGSQKGWDRITCIWLCCHRQPSCMRDVWKNVLGKIITGISQHLHLWKKII